MSNKKKPRMKRSGGDAKKEGDILYSPCQAKSENFI